MNSKPKHRTVASTALFGRPERPFVYANSVTLPDGSVGYDRPLENYFDTSMVSQLLPSHNSSKLYDTVARAHDNRFQVSPNVLDPSVPVPRTLLLNQSEGPRCLAKVSSTTTDYMGISSHAPEWRPRRSSYEDLRGVLAVSPTNTNTLVPSSVPPIDFSMPPELQEWLEAFPKPTVANAQLGLQDSQPMVDDSQSSTEDDFSFDFDSDGSPEVQVFVPRTPTPQPEAAESEFDPYDSDADSGSEYIYKSTPMELSGGDTDPLHFQKRPSVEPVDDEDVASDATPPPPVESSPRKRRRGGKSGPQVTKMPKRHVNDSPARHSERINMQHQSDPTPGPSQASSVESGAVSVLNSPTVIDLDHDRIESGPTSPPAGSQLNSSSTLKLTRPFPCLLDGCTQICASLGDLLRHQQSLRHSIPSYPCLTCGKSYTRPDALKRHLKVKPSCKKLHTRKTSNNADGEPMQTEANTETQ